MDAKKLSDFQKNILLEYFAYTLSPEQRQELMQQFPEIYNAWTGREMAYAVYADGNCRIVGRWQHYGLTIAADELEA